MINNFAAFVLTHGRPDRVYTVKALKRCGYTGKVYIIVDNEDKCIDKYRANFGDNVIVFDKAEIAKQFDEGDNTNDRRAVIYARNACWDIARKLGINYFVQLDDDYHRFDYRFAHDRRACLPEKIILNLDSVFQAIIDYYKSANIRSVCMMQGGDYIGYSYIKTIRTFRKCMNSFFCSTDRRFNFVGRINEDVNTYCISGNRGDVFMSINSVSLKQTDTQSNSGGMTELYLDNGTYIKSFYTVMYCPSFVDVRLMQTERPRLHHRINWRNAVPCIIPERYCKKISEQNGHAN